MLTYNEFSFRPVCIFESDNIDIDSGVSCRRHIFPRICSDTTSFHARSVWKIPDTRHMTVLHNGGLTLYPHKYDIVDITYFLNLKEMRKSQTNYKYIYINNTVRKYSISFHDLKSNLFAWIVVYFLARKKYFCGSNQTRITYLSSCLYFPSPHVLRAFEEISHIV